MPAKVLREAARFRSFERSLSRDLPGVHEWLLVAYRGIGVNVYWKSTGMGPR
jgi:hypothetical protein